MRKASDRRNLLCLALLAAVAALQYLQVELSYVTLDTFLYRGLKLHLLCYGTMLLLNLFPMLFTRKFHVSCRISSVLVLILSVVNHFCCLYAGGPFSPVLFASSLTGLSVLGGYSFLPDRNVIVSVLFFLLEIGITFLMRRLSPAEPPDEAGKRRRVWFYLFVNSFLVLAVVASNLYLVRDSLYCFYPGDLGYATFFIQSALRIGGEELEEPEGYDREKLEKEAEKLKGKEGRTAKEEYPDIILVLNETFYDPEHYTELETDVPYLENYQSAENAIKGYAVTPYTESGTNDSEFELLTGISSRLFTQKAPFTTCSSLDRIVSVARYLSGLGYSTQALHSCDSMHYNRKVAYPNIGFDKARFYDDFSEHENYGNRRITDASNYRDLIKWYEDAGDAPRFLYLLTYQNHGGYEQNDGSMDTVHVSGETNGLEDQLNEFLTSIRMSDEALGELLDYFDGADRPVLVCMMGDHCPAFLSQLPGLEGEEKKDLEIRSRETPFLLWGNRVFGKIDEKNVVVEMTDIMPMVLDTAGLPLSPFYQYLRELSESIPIRMEDGYCVTAEGDGEYLEAEDEGFDEVNLPKYIEYAAMKETDERWNALFQPPEEKRQK